VIFSQLLQDNKKLLPKTDVAASNPEHLAALDSQGGAALVG
jgi:hypothetical protein